MRQQVRAVNQLGVESIWSSAGWLCYPLAMFRPTKCLSQAVRQKDWMGLLILAVAALIAVWIVSILFATSSRRAAIERFQLASPSYLAWAVQGPVPSMYNFENRMQFSNEMPGDQPFDTDDESWFGNPINHFPARCMTFGDHFPTCFSKVKQGTFEMSTRYRETELISRWEIREQPDGTLMVHRLPEKWVDHESD